MKYMLLAYMDENAWLALSKEQQMAEMAKCEPHVKKLLAAGKILDGAPLHPTSTATTVRKKGGKRLVTDGPFAETREQLGGYTIIEAANLDEAIDIAAGFYGDADDDNGLVTTLEVRPIVDYKMPDVAGS
jgi:hypothetical protein